jgi:hypothetical protein
LSYENNTGDCIIHALPSDGSYELQQCILLGASYVQKIIRALNNHFLDLPIFNTTNFFSRHNYSCDDSDQNTNTKLGLKRILLKFQHTKEESDMCKGELIKFIETLQHECEA